MSPTRKDPENLTLSPGNRETHGERKTDFSKVTGGMGSTARPAGPETGRSHTVEKGDTLSAISKQYYGNANRWEDIFNANRDQLDDPDLIQPGQVLRIP